ncbi:hypothetical protein P43SY_000277 [Pythium insidiosum]|uniref:Amino acid permease/ SLC12A domain-containing protein n=1 Tax=Pythium insidiosum TaxID=114742 RepID=A0AAD5LAR4_PYTIN|nr:hypothetical protein P43SY_000277 [Pythium insidiosum]
MQTDTIAIRTETPKSSSPIGRVVPVDRPSAIALVADNSLAAEAAVRHYKPNAMDIYLLGITLVISGQFFSWNLGLGAGLYTYLIIYAIMALAYTTFCCCVSEVTSALPFAGGSYGLARCTLGFFPAFLIGCCEAVEYISSVAVIVIGMTDMCVSIQPSLKSYKPLLWLLYYVPATAIQIVGGSGFWIFNLAVGAFSLIVLLIHCFGVLPLVDFSKHALADSTQMYVGGFSQAMYVFPFSAWFFLGIEAMGLSSRDLERPKTQVPAAQVTCIVSLVITGIFAFLTTVSLPVDGGIATIAGALAPLSNGFMQVLKISSNAAIALSIPPQYAAAFGLSWAASKLVNAMASSKLLPPSLAVTSQRYGTPHIAIVLNAVLGYGVCLMVYFVPKTTVYILPVCLLFAFTSYSGQCMGYISLKLGYPLTNQSAFKNPFGIVGAVYALCVWVTGIVAILGFQGNDGAEALFFLAVLVVLVIYYQLVAGKRQIMSEEESKILLVAHILRFNASKKSRYSSKQSSKPSRVSVSHTRPMGATPKSQGATSTAGDGTHPH